MILFELKQEIDEFEKHIKKKAKLAFKEQFRFFFQDFPFVERVIFSVTKNFYSTELQFKRKATKDQKVASLQELKRIEN